MSKEERRNELNDSNGSLDWAEMFNGLPREVRRISTALECKTRIQHLNMEKDRLKRRHAQSVKEINDISQTVQVTCDNWKKRTPSTSTRRNDAVDSCDMF